MRSIIDTQSNPTEVVVEWPGEAKPGPAPCSFNRCPNGHSWPMTIATAECPGCKAPVLVMMMQNCPMCNEPTEASVLRTDHVMRGGGVAAQCLGQKNAAEVTIVEMERTHAKQIEDEALSDAVEEHTRRSSLQVGK